MLHPRLVWTQQGKRPAEPEQPDRAMDDFHRAFVIRSGGSEWPLRGKHPSDAVAELATRFTLEFHTLDGVLAWSRAMTLLVAAVIERSPGTTTSHAQVR